MSQRVPRLLDRGDIKGGLFHILAEITALVTLLAVMSVLAWSLLQF